MARTTAWELAGHWSASDEQLHYASLVFNYFIIIIFFLFCPIKLPLSQPTGFLTFILLILFSI